MSNDDTKSNLDIFLSRIKIVAEILAIILAGIWFMRQGDNDKRAEIKSKAEIVRLTDHRVLVQYSAKLKNIGKVPFVTEECLFRSSLILPIDNYVKPYIDNPPIMLNNTTSRVPWCTIKEYRIKKKCELAPGEEGDFTCDFIFSDKVKTAKLYAYIPYNKKIGWTDTTIVDFRRLK